jgi:2-oxoacid dehydrogenases acyltransferase (catalytic domain)
VGMMGLGNRGLAWLLNRWAAIAAFCLCVQKGRVGWIGVAILVHGGSLLCRPQLPRFVADGNVESVSIMNISWGADHRVVDGATLARFSNLVKRYIEEPDRLLLHLS